MNWSQVKLYTQHDAISIVSGFLISHGLRGLMIEDATEVTEFLEETSQNWDYIDEAVLDMKSCETAVVFYLPETMQGIEMLREIQADVVHLPAQTPGIDFGTLTFESEILQQEDWETSWKKYYHPVEIGKRLVICPFWEEYQTAPHQVKVLLDPGMAFGTGTHETTRLCMAYLDEEITADSTVLDVGTGSGILAITALLLGAKHVVGIDIDELAVKIAGENAALNHVADQVEFLCGDLTEKIDGQYDFICANIVADVLIRLADQILPFMHKNSKLMVSGIIEDRQEDVFSALRAAGLKHISTKTENDWVSALWMLVE